MKIEHKDVEVELSDIEAGQCFYLDGNVYLKANTIHVIQAVNLHTGRLITINANQKVKKVKAKVVYSSQGQA